MAESDPEAASINGDEASAQSHTSLPSIEDHEFEYILTSLLGLSANHILRESLQRADVTSLFDLLSLSEDHISGLTIAPPSRGGRTRQPLPQGSQGLLRAFKGYVRWSQRNGVPFNVLTHRREQFNAFRISLDWNPDAPPDPVTTVFSRSPAEEFRRSVKRDKTHYLPFKDDKQWDSWKRSTISTARSHGCEDVFNPSYQP